MGIASLILGLMALLASWIPIVGFFWIPASIIGIVLGIVAIVQSNQDNGDSKATAVSGLVASVLALISIVGFTIFWATRVGLGSIEIVEGGIEQFPSEPAGAAVVDGQLSFRTLAFGCELVGVDPLFTPQGSDRVCTVEFEVSYSGADAAAAAHPPPSAIVNSTNQYLLAERGEDVFLAPPGVETWIVKATDGSCVDREVRAGSPQLCSARFENLRTTGLDEETIRYHSSYASLGALVSLVSVASPGQLPGEADPAVDNDGTQIQRDPETGL